MDDGSGERDFHHPYQPYDIQKQFMNAVYDCLEDGKVGIFESPTGTGKSLSLICGSLTWLRDHKRRVFEEGTATEARDDDEPAWVVERSRQQRKDAALRRKRDLDARIAKIRAKEKRAKDRYQNGEPHHKRQKVVDTDDGRADEAEFVLDDYESGDEAACKGRDNGASYNDSNLSAETLALMQKLGFAVGGAKEDAEEDIDEMKIFFCSRTHSQLTQFSGELNRVKLPPAFTSDSHVDDDKANSLADDVKYLTLGSRKNLCINSKVSKLGNATAINERCLELQQPKTSAECKCPFMPTKETEPLVNDFRDYALAKVRDIEDLGSLGKKLGICPYYASRPATKSCEVGISIMQVFHATNREQIVTLPYPLLLQKSAREALNLSLKDHVVIIDEAHNLMDAIIGIYSVSVTLDQIQRARMQLTVYLQKFRNRLKGKNRVYVAQTIRILDSVMSYLQSKLGDRRCNDGIVEVADLTSGKGIDQVNFFKLNTYLQESRLARKVDGYTSYSEEQGKTGNDRGGKQMPRRNVPVLLHVQSFLLSLMNPSGEGRFFFRREETGDIALSYMLLDPTYHFKDIVEEARAVVLAGGTMSPMSDYEQHLLSYLDPSKIMTLSCGHVIPPSNLLACPIVQAASGSDFEFTFEKRNSDKMMIDLGHALRSIAQHVPDGVVVFFPSYSYLDNCAAAWKRLRSGGTLNGVTIWESLQTVKPIFLEQRTQHQPTEEGTNIQGTSTGSVLDVYSNAIVTGNGRGAVLFAVVGGTLSEGINFSDALGRGVVVIGLPFPNPHSAEWKAKMQYISAKATSNGRNGKDGARDFYENACMRAVNQCVGRAIRHRGDYAAIMMLDRRYSAPRIQAKLPRWIQGSLANGAGVRDVEKRLDEFFAGK
ncbi:TFIIH basal transcription factor complex helicase subunit [Lophiotrema nucula]|uniref:ATP-dependent DNA helicase CHL1 n=1 Tax=Lophiotrema nucula TaxID=690887 RepID=A0A6A5YME3_9PLEO|nr:TFIIH basal transcription factor complex helicase subunit [Lophiotrema nucula]